MLKHQRGLFLNILKWFMLSTIVGIVVGVADAAFLTLLDKTTSKANAIPYYFLSLPVVLWLTSVLASRVAPRDKDYSTDAAIHKINSYKPISFKSTLKAFFLPVLTIASGGSAGKEAPCADVGAGMASMMSGLFKLDAADRRKLMICGVSAGFAGVFGVPISGAIFGLEVLWVGYIFYEVMFPAFVAGITAHQVTSYLGVEYVYHPINFMPVFNEGFFIKVIVAGIFFGLISLLFIEIMKFFRTAMRFIAFKTSRFWAAFIGGSILAAIGLLISPEFLGLGMDSTNAVLHGAEPEYAMGALYKMITTAITFSSGGVGGIVTPIFFVGSQAGAVLSMFLEVDMQTMAALGVVAVLAGTTNAPLAASIMAIELFGPAIAPYAAVCCVISFMMKGQSSIFTKQKISLIKDFDDKNSSPDRSHHVHNMPVRRASFLKLARHLMPKEVRKPNVNVESAPPPIEHKEPKAPPPPTASEQEAALEKTFRGLTKHLMPDFKDKDKK